MNASQVPWDSRNNNTLPPPSYNAQKGTGHVQSSHIPPPPSYNDQRGTWVFQNSHIPPPPTYNPRTKTWALENSHIPPPAPYKEEQGNWADDSHVLLPRDNISSFTGHGPMEATTLSSVDTTQAMNDYLRAPDGTIIALLPNGIVKEEKEEAVENKKKKKRTKKCPDGVHFATRMRVKPNCKPNGYIFWIASQKTKTRHGLKREECLYRNFSKQWILHSNENTKVPSPQELRQCIADGRVNIALNWTKDKKTLSAIIDALNELEKLFFTPGGTPR